MSHGLRTVVEGLRRAALAVPPRTFAAAAVRQPLLADHANMTAVLTALDDERAETYPRRDALTRALVNEHQHSHDPVWSSALVVAYFPMLCRLRNRLVSDTIPREELDQVVITAFLSAVNDLNEHERTDRIAMRLRQRTERQVFAFLRSEREHQLPTDTEEREQLEAELRELHPEPRTDQHLFDVVRLLEKAAAAGLPDHCLDALKAPLVHREMLREFVARNGPADGLSRNRLYQRLKRRRSRALKRLRDLLGLSPAPASGGS